MQLASIDNPTFTLTPQATHATAGGLSALDGFEVRFDQVLEKQSDKDAMRDELHGVAVQFVGMAFFFPMLQQARNNPFKTDMFHGGFAEDTFGNQMDLQLADRMAQRDTAGLVSAMVQRYSAAVERKVDVHG